MWVHRAPDRAALRLSHARMSRVDMLRLSCIGY
jgi:hypothetical protein